MALILGLALLLMGCGGGSPTPLADNSAWKFASLNTNDPFSTEEGATVDCPETSYGPEAEAEETWYSIETDDCSYITVEQPLLTDLSVGDQVTINVFHFSLTAPQPSESHIALAVDADVVWETAVPIPSPSGSVVETFEVTKDYPKGAPLFFHIHNHGQNSYALIELKLNP